MKTLEVARGRRRSATTWCSSNTFHLFLVARPRPRRSARRRAPLHALGPPGDHRLRRLPGLLDGPRHGRRRDQGPRRAAAERSGAILGIDEEGVRFRSYVDGAAKFMGPETSMEVQAALGSDIALVFDECLPFHVTREYTDALDRAHAPVAGPLPRLARRQRPREWQGVYGIVQGGVDEDLRRWSAQEVAAPRRPSASRSAARWARTRRRCTRSSAGRPRSCPRSGRATCSGSATSTTSCAASSSASTPSTARCRRASGATAWRSCPIPDTAGASTSPRAATASPTSRSAEGCPCAACAVGYSRAYLHYLFRLRETTGARIVTLHNLAYLQQLMAALRAAIDAGELDEAIAAARAGAAPWELG